MAIISKERRSNKEGRAHEVRFLDTYKWVKIVLPSSKSRTSFFPLYRQDPKASESLHEIHPSSPRLDFIESSFPEHSLPLGQINIPSRLTLFVLPSFVRILSIEPLDRVEGEDRLSWGALAGISNRSGRTRCDAKTN